MIANELCKACVDAMEHEKLDVPDQLNHFNSTVGECVSCNEGWKSLGLSKTIVWVGLLLGHACTPISTHLVTETSIKEHLGSSLHLEILNGSDWPARQHL